MTKVCERCGKEYAAASPECPYCPGRPTRYAVFAVLVALLSLVVLASAALPAERLVSGDEARGAFISFHNTAIARTGVLGRIIHMVIAVIGFVCAGALWLWKRWSPEAFASWFVLTVVWSGFAAGSAAPSEVMTSVVIVGLGYWYLRTGRPAVSLES